MPARPAPVVARNFRRLGESILPPVGAERPGNDDEGRKGDRLSASGAPVKKLYSFRTYETERDASGGGCQGGGGTATAFDSRALDEAGWCCTSAPKRGAG